MDPSLSELLLPGLKLMLIGMGIVFLFLALLVWIIGFIASLVRLYSPPPEQRKRTAAAETDESELVAVIAAALSRRTGG